MITEAVREVCEMCEYTEGIQVCISIPGGEEVAKKRSIQDLGLKVACRCLAQAELSCR